MTGGAAVTTAVFTSADLSALLIVVIVIAQV
jgi:hypothetical protein